MIDTQTYTNLKNLAKNFLPSKYLDDIVHEVFLQIYSNPERLKQLIDNKQLKYYFIRLCKNNYYSKTSKYYYKYKRQYKDIIFNTDTMKLACKLKADTLYFIEDADLINDILDGLYWYDRELFKLYVLGDNNGKRFTYTSLSKKTKISRMNIYITIKKVKEYIKEELNKKRNGF